MKNVRLIDALPTVFGIIAVIGLVMETSLSPNTTTGPLTALGPMLLFAGGAISLATGLASVVNAMMRHSFGKVHVLNIGWVLLPGIFFIWSLSIALTWR
jgi:hypothetical protein